MDNLCIICYSDNLELVKTFFTNIELSNHSEKFNNIEDLYGDTPLHIACIKNNLEMVIFLISKGACINKKNKFNGSTPLHYACFNKNLKIVHILTKNGAIIDEKNEYGCTPLHIACGAAYDREGLDVVKFLILNKANIFVKDNKNRKPLERLIEKDRFEINIFISNTLNKPNGNITER